MRPPLLFLLAAALLLPAQAAGEIYSWVDGKGVVIQYVPFFDS